MHKDFKRKHTKHIEITSFFLSPIEGEKVDTKKNFKIRMNKKKLVIDHTTIENTQKILNKKTVLQMRTPVIILHTFNLCTKFTGTYMHTQIHIYIIHTSTT